jgi:hypothetical protein
LVLNPVPLSLNNPSFAFNASYHQPQTFLVDGGMEDEDNKTNNINADKSQYAIEFLKIPPFSRVPPFPGQMSSQIGWPIHPLHLQLSLRACCVRPRLAARLQAQGHAAQN